MPQKPISKIKKEKIKEEVKGTDADHASEKVVPPEQFSVKEKEKTEQVTKEVHHYYYKKAHLLMRENGFWDSLSLP